MEECCEEVKTTISSLQSSINNLIDRISSVEANFTDIVTRITKIEDNGGGSTPSNQRFEKIASFNMKPNSYYHIPNDNFSNYYFTSATINPNNLTTAQFNSNGLYITPTSYTNGTGVTAYKYLRYNTQSSSSTQHSIQLIGISNSAGLDVSLWKEKFS